MVILPRRIYSAIELTAMGVFASRHKHTVANIILTDKLDIEPILKAEIRGTGRGRRYYIKGANAIAYMKREEEEKERRQRLQARFDRLSGRKK